MALAKTKTKVVRILLLEKMKEKEISITKLSLLTGFNRGTIDNLINCRRYGEIPAWKKIQEALSLKDKDMWAIINTTKRIYR